MTNIIKRVYVDASAVGGAFNRYAEQTRPFWNAVKSGKVAIVLSDVLDREAEKAPLSVRNFLELLPESKFEPPMR